MADVFREVDEDLRREQLKKLWDRFGPYVIGLAVLIVLGVSGYKLWEYWTLHQAQSTGDRFIAAMDLADQGKNADALTALQGVAGDGTGSYPVLAQFRIASAKADSGDSTGAVADYDAIAARTDVSPDIRNMARLRAALILVDTASTADINKQIGDLAAVGNPWHNSAREILALSAWRTGDYASAKDYFGQIDADQEAPQDMRDRAQVMLSMIAVRLAATGGGSASAATPAAPAPEPAQSVVAPAVAPTEPAPAQPTAAPTAPATAPTQSSAAPAPVTEPAQSATPAPATEPAPSAAPAETTAAPAAAPSAPDSTPAPAPAPANPGNSAG
jgi:hypothetical protein